MTDDSVAKGYSWDDEALCLPIPPLSLVQTPCCRGTVMRVAPAPLYNSYKDVWRFVNILEAALDTAANNKA